MFKLNKVVFLMLLGISTLGASTMFTLSGVKEVYPVIEIQGKSLDKEYKKEIKSSINEMLDTLGIKHDGYNQRAFALLVHESLVGSKHMITTKLVIGEQVHRLDSKEKTFALTYENMDNFTFDNKDEVEDKLEDSISILLDKFEEQYKEEQKKIVKVKVSGENFASQMNYETNYEKAMAKGKRLNKPVMLVLVANYCPWCRKFENRVLIKKDVNDIIQQDYIPVILNKEKDAFPKELDKSFTPIIYFIDSKTQKSYAMVAGYNNKDEFLYILKKNHN